MRKKARRTFALERLEQRDLLAGDCSVSVVAGDLVIAGDALGNQIEIRQISTGKYEVAGRDGTLVNGAPSFLANKVNDDFIIDMGQGGSDSVKLLGALRVPDRLDAVMGDGELQILGTTGVLRVSGVVDIRRDSPDVEFELTVQDQVRFDGKVTLTGCDSAFIESRGELAGPTFAGPLVIMSCNSLDIQSFDQSVGPRFKKSITLGAGPPTDSFDVRVASHDDSVGPRFDGAVKMVLGESMRIESNDTSTGPRFDGAVDVWAAINVVVQSHHASDGLQFRGPVKFQAADDVFITSEDQSQGATFHGNANFGAGVSVVVVSSDDSVGPVFKGKVGMETELDVLVWSRDNSVGPVFRQRVNMTAGTEVSIDAWETSVGPAFYANLQINAGANVDISSISAVTAGPSFRAPVNITTTEDLLIQRVSGATSSARFTELHATVGGNEVIDGARFTGPVTVQMAENDNRLRVVDSIFAKAFRADGGLGADTFENGGGNSFTGGLNLKSFETMLP